MSEEITQLHAETPERITRYEYTLLSPVTYAGSNGQLSTAAFVELRAPTSRNRKECAKLKQAFFRSLPQDGKVEVDADPDAKAEAQGQMTGASIMGLIAMSPHADLDEVIEVGAALLKNQTAYLDGEQKLTQPLIDALTYEDLENLIGEFLRNFTLRSALS